jgi:hypothetical protein
MTDTQKPAPVFDANGWCHDMSLAPKGEPVDLWFTKYRIPSCFSMKPMIEWGLEHWLKDYVWCEYGADDLEPVDRCHGEATAWRLPPAPPVKGGM